MRLRVKKCIHLMVILLALIETFTGAVIDCVVYTIFYPAAAVGLEHDATSSTYYFTAHLLPTKHFYRLIVVLYVPILYLWRSRAVGWRAEGAAAAVSDGCTGSHAHSRVLGVFRTQIPRSFLPATVAWLSQRLRRLHATDSSAVIADDFDALGSCWCLRQASWSENRKSLRALVHYRSLEHDSVIKHYNTRVCCTYLFSLFVFVIDCSSVFLLELTRPLRQ